MTKHPIDEISQSPNLSHATKRKFPKRPYAYLIVCVNLSRLSTIAGKNWLCFKNKTLPLRIVISQWQYFRRTAHAAIEISFFFFFERRPIHLRVTLILVGIRLNIFVDKIVIVDSTIRNLTRKLFLKFQTARGKIGAPLKRGYWKYRRQN